MDVRDLFDHAGDDEDVSVLGPTEAAPRERDEPGAAPQAVVHRLLAPNGEAAEALAAILRNHGYETEVRDPGARAAEEGGAWRVDARKERAEDDNRALVTELAAEHGAEYEGAQPSAA